MGPGVGIDDLYLNLSYRRWITVAVWTLLLTNRQHLRLGSLSNAFQHDDDDRWGAVGAATPGVGPRTLTVCITGVWDGRDNAEHPHPHGRTLRTISAATCVAGRGGNTEELCLWFGLLAQLDWIYFHESCDSDHAKHWYKTLEATFEGVHLPRRSLHVMAFSPRQLHTLAEPTDFAAAWRDGTDLFFHPPGRRYRPHVDVFHMHWTFWAVYGKLAARLRDREWVEPFELRIIPRFLDDFAHDVPNRFLDDPVLTADLPPWDLAVVRRLWRTGVAHFDAAGTLDTGGRCDDRHRSTPLPGSVPAHGAVHGVGGRAPPSQWIPIALWHRDVTEHLLAIGGDDDDRPSHLRLPTAASFPTWVLRSAQDHLLQRAPPRYYDADPVLHRYLRTLHPGGDWTRMAAVVRYVLYLHAPAWLGLLGQYVAHHFPPP